MEVITAFYLGKEFVIDSGELECEKKTLFFTENDKKALKTLKYLDCNDNVINEIKENPLCKLLMK